MHISKYLLRKTSLFYHSIVLFLTVCISYSSCFNEEFSLDYSGPIIFSQDTLRFDTVFTTVGSITREFKIINPSKENIVLKSIRLEREGNSMFRLNVDGIPGNKFESIKILSNDSIYVFVEVTIDPNQPISVSPFVIEEKIIVSSSGEERKLVLEAWGQNANYVTGRNAKGQLLKLSCGGGTISWNDLKPYVVHGLLFIDSCTLKIPAGRSIYFHGAIARIGENYFNDGGLLILKSGKLVVEGTLASPVTFQGDRLEQEYRDVPGQWAGIRLLAGSSASISQATIKNSIVGVRADSASTLNLNGVRIFNSANAGLIGVHSTINADNCLIHSTETQSIALVYGGNYSFRHTTLANYENSDPALYADNFNCLNSDCSLRATNPLNASFVNCIISGSNRDEVLVADGTKMGSASTLNLVFDHSLLKIDETKTLFNFMTSCVDCVEHLNEKLFINENKDNYALDTSSIARNKGIYISDLPFDIIGIQRKLNRPDLGCFSFKE